MCSFDVDVLTLVGGAWNNESRAGLWYWNINEASSIANGNVGARLLIGTWCVCYGCRLFDTLVGGNWTNTSYCGLWYWNLNNASSDVNATIGARPLILRIGN